MLGLEAAVAYMCSSMAASCTEATSISTRGRHLVPGNAGANPTNKVCKCRSLTGGGGACIPGY